MPKTGGGLIFVNPKLTKPGSINGHKTGGGLVYVNPHNAQNSKNKGKKKEKKKIDAIRGKEITIRDSAAPAQVIYGIMRVGGITTMIHTSNLSSAYLQTGEESKNNALLWSAVTAGDAGNSLTVQLFHPGPSNPTTSCSLTSGNQIKITLATNGSGVITSTLNQVMTALQSHAPSAALVKCQKVFKNTNGVVEVFAQTSLQYGGGEYLHQIITLAGHKIDSVMKLYLDGREVVFGASPDSRWSTGYFTDSGGSLVFMAVNYGDDDQLAQPDAIGQIPTIWTSSHRQAGCAHVYLLTRYSKTVFSEGFPEIEFLVKGKPVYDPRTGQTAFTDSFGSVIGQNAALIANDYLTNTRFGVGCTTVDQTALIAAANSCDEDIARSGGLPTEKRYALNSSFDPTQGAESIIGEIEMGMAGKIFSRDGKVFIYPGVWRAPSITFTIDDLRGDVIINQTHVPRSERFNWARGTFVSDVDFQETDIPYQKNDGYRDEDGGVIYEDFPINFVTSPTQCQRILKIELEKVRQGIQASIPLKLSGLLVNVGDTINLDLSQPLQNPPKLPLYGWAPKIFEVMNLQIVVEDDGVIGVDLELRETAAGVFDWNNGFETTGDLAPNTTLPSATDVSPPSLVVVTSGTAELYTRGDGTIQSRMKVAWTAPNSNFVTSGGGYHIRHKRTTDSNWIATEAIQDSAIFHYILDVKDGETYNVEIRSFNTIGFTSSWVAASAHLVVGKTALPTEVLQSSFAAVANSFGILLSWSDIPDLDRADYEIRVGTSFATGLLVWRGKGTSFRWDNKASGIYDFWIRSYDTSGNYSAGTTTATLTITAPPVPTVTYEIIGENVKLMWSTTAGSFPLKESEIRYGPSYDTGYTAVGISTANNMTLKVDWLIADGVRTFWVVNRDISGNQSDPATTNTPIIINPPNVVENFGVKTASNNILMDWTDPDPSTLPVAEYRVRKGANYGSSILLGVVYGTFHAYIEDTGGSFTYYVQTVDTAGNIGSFVSVSALIVIPNNFFISSNINFVNMTPSEEAITSEVIVNGIRVPISSTADTLDEIFLPVQRAVASGVSLPLLLGYSGVSYVEQSWDNWWTANSWTAWQDAITAGFDAAYPTPTTVTPGYAEWIVNYGVVFAGSFIDFSDINITTIGDAVNFTYDIAVSLDGISYTTYTGVTGVFASNFQYVKYKINWTGTTTKSLVKITSARAVIGLATEEETQVVAVLAADEPTPNFGTTCTFQKSYLDVQDIQATPTGTSIGARIAVVNFTDIPNPTFCKILLYDAAGTALSGNVNVRIRGAVNPVI